MTEIHDKIAAAVPATTKGQVWCRSCCRTETVDGATALRTGWPKCCGKTMTIDHPDTWGPYAAGAR